MAFSSIVWEQLRQLSADALIIALKKDGWTPDPSSVGNILGFIKNSGKRRRVMFSFHPGQSYGPRMLMALVNDIGWSGRDLKRLRLTID